MKNPIKITSSARSAADYFTADVERFDLMIEAYEQALQLRYDLASKLLISDAPDYAAFNLEISNLGKITCEKLSTRAGQLIAIITSAHDAAENQAKLGITEDEISQAVQAACDQIRDRHIWFILYLELLGGVDL